MITITEAEARAQGLTVLGPDGVPMQETPGERVDRAARAAAELAAVLDSMLRVGGASRRGMEAVRDGVGELHAELTELAEEVRRELAARPWSGVTS